MSATGSGPAGLSRSCRGRGGTPAPPVARRRPRAGRRMGAGRAGRGPQAADAALSGGQVLRRYRSAAGLTQEELAARAGYSADYIGKLERGRRELPAAAAGHLAAVLGLGDEERAA